MKVGKILRTVLLAVVALSAPKLLGECQTNAPGLVDLTTWTNVQYGPFGQPQANWVLQGSNTVVQTVNADASIFIGPFTLAADQIEGSWRVEAGEDDDFIGFVFGFQDPQHFYLFDWKQAAQVHPSGAVGQQGIAVKVIHADSSLMAGDLYATAPVNTNRARNLYYNPNVAWVDFTEYQFNLQFFPGQFTITVSQGATVLDRFTITNSTYTSGRFGFYNFSQGPVRYSGFARQILEQRPVAIIQDRSVVEGNSGTTQLVFNVTLSETNCDSTSFDYVIVPGSATAGADYTVSPASGTLMFLPGETNKQVTVTVIGDILSEGNETFFLTLTNAVRGLIVDRQAMGTILNDDTGPPLRIGNVSVVEGNAGTVTAIFQVSLASQSGLNVQVQYFTRNGTALAGSDYGARSLSTLVIPAGQTSAPISVTVLGDTAFEPDETFFVCLTNAIGGTLSTVCATGTIQNDDGNTPPTVTIVAPTEGAVFPAPPGIVRIEAEATDSDGFVEQVDFYVNGAFQQSVTTVPRAIFWTNLVFGPYELTAVARDNHGIFGTSAPVRITLRACDASLTATELTDQTRCICDEAVFSTIVASGDAVTYVWKANDVVLPGETNNVLILRGLKEGQAGTYTVEVSSPCATISRSATLTLKGGGTRNPVFFTNSSRVTIVDNANAIPYPSIIEVECIPGVVRHVSVTLHGLSHNYPDDADILLVGPSGAAVRLMSDAGGSLANRLVDVLLTLSDIALEPLPDSTRIMPGEYRPTDYPPAEAFPAPAPASVTALNFAPFLGTNANGTWSLFARDDTGVDSGSIANGWSLRIEWDSVAPRLSSPILLPDGQIEMTLVDPKRMTHFIEASADLVTWTPIATVSPDGDAVVRFELQFQHRFYRAVCCP